jgi:arginase
MEREHGGERRISVGLVPFDAGNENWRMGAGPVELFDVGFRRILAQRGTAVRPEGIDPETSWRTELRTTFDLHHRIAEFVVAGSSRTLIVAGDCSATVGVVAGVGQNDRVGVLWFDAHADMETPETDPSGYLDGQGLAMLVGRCWRAHTASLPGFVPVPEHRVLLVGARDLGVDEEADLAASAIGRIGARADPAEADAAISAWLDDVDTVHIHVDVDVIDETYGRANDWASPGGMSPSDVVGMIRRVTPARPVVSAVLASWDPAADDQDALRIPVQEVATALIDALDPDGLDRRVEPSPA